MSYVELSGLSKRFGDVLAVDDISVSVERGEFFTIVGPSGCGKSTTLRMIAGFESPTSGRITIGGTDVESLDADERDVGLVFQSYALFPHMTAAENVGFGLRMEGVPEDERRRRVDDALSLVDLPTVGDQYPDALSGGQQQRVALARALVVEPDVLLLDEPLSNLDQQLREELQDELKRIQSETEVTTIHVTHDQAEAMTLADRMCVLRDGRIEQVAPPETVYDRPKTRFVSDFVGQANVLDATLVREGTETEIAVDAAPSLRFPAPESLPTGAAGPGAVVIRPADFLLERSDPAPTGGASAVTGPADTARNDTKPTGETTRATDTATRDDTDSTDETMRDDTNPTDETTKSAGATTFEATVDSRQFRGEFMRYQLTYTDESGTVELIAHDSERYDVGDDVSVSVSRDDVVFHPAEAE